MGQNHYTTSSSPATLKCHALKRCTFWRETCLASVFALRLVNQRARAANQRARAANRCTRTLARTLSGSVFALRLADRLRSGICLASALRSQSQCQVHYTLKSDFRKVPIRESAGFRGIGEEAAGGDWKLFGKCSKIRCLLHNRKKALQNTGFCDKIFTCSLTYVKKTEKYSEDLSDTTIFRKVTPDVKLHRRLRRIINEIKENKHGKWS